MKLHANSPLGPKGRAIMVRRVVEQGWSLTEAAEAAGVSEGGDYLDPALVGAVGDRRRGGASVAEAGLALGAIAPDPLAAGALQELQLVLVRVGGP